MASSSSVESAAPSTNSTSPALTSCPAFTTTLPMVMLDFALTLWLPLAVTVPVPRTLAVIVPFVTMLVATSGREWFIIVLEKKVSKSSTTRNTIAASLTHALFFGFVSISIPR